MTWRFKEKVLPPGAVASLKDSRLQGISVGDPTAAKPGEASAGGSLDVSTAGTRVGSDASDPAGAQEGHPALFRARASRQGQDYRRIHDAESRPYGRLGAAVRAVAASRNWPRRRN